MTVLASRGSGPSQGLEVRSWLRIFPGRPTASFYPDRGCRASARACPMIGAQEPSDLAPTFVRPQGRPRDAPARWPLLRPRDPLTVSLPPADAVGGEVGSL